MTLCLSVPVAYADIDVDDVEGSEHWRMKLKRDTLRRRLDPTRVSECQTLYGKLCRRCRSSSNADVEIHDTLRPNNSIHFMKADRESLLPSFTA